MKRILLFVAAFSSMTTAATSYACQCRGNDTDGWEQVGSCTPEQAAEGCYPKTGGGGGGGGGGGDEIEFPKVPIEEVSSFFTKILGPKNLQSENRSHPSCNPAKFGD